MIYKKVEKIKEEISSIGIGCWNFGGDWDASSDENTEKIVLTALENGINFFDIAPVYGFSHSEAILGKIMKNMGSGIRLLSPASAAFAGEATRSPATI